MIAQFVILKSVFVEKKIVSLDKIEGKRGLGYIRIGMLSAANKLKKRNYGNLNILLSLILT